MQAAKLEHIHKIEARVGELYKSEHIQDPIFSFSDFQN